MSIAAEIAKMVGEQPPRSSTHRATVLRTDNDGTTWVSIPGGADETPLHGTLVECAPGDVVDVTIANGRATATANATSPAATGRTVSVVRETAETAQLTADDAAEAAASAIEDATLARTAAESAQASAQDAETAAGAASIAADNAQVAANAATFALSDVEKVVGTLEWIAEHGEYQLTTDTAVVAGKVYYTRSGTDPDYTYTVVAEPRTADIATYYELHMDESVQNFIASHLWLDAYGLNLSVDSSNGYRVHQGTVDGTKAMGMYVLDATGAAVASFGADGFQVGTASKSRLIGDYHSLIMTDTEGDYFFQIRDLRDRDGIANLVAFYYGDGATASFPIGLSNITITSVKIDGVEATAYTRDSQGITLTQPLAAGSQLRIDYKSSESNLDELTFGFRTGASSGAMSASFGAGNEASGICSFAEGASNVARGMYSHVEGYNSDSFGYASHAEGRQSLASGDMSHAEGSGTTASGDNSHAEGSGTVASYSHAHAEGYGTVASNYAAHGEGNQTTASGVYSHSEGSDTEASGWAAHSEGQESIASGYASHAQNLGTIAAKKGQTALGKYNVEDTTLGNVGQHAVIIGNGTSESNRSNALTVGWDGSVDAAGDASIAGDVSAGGALAVTGDATMGGSLDVAGDITAANIGNVVSMSNGAISVASDTYKTIASFSLAAGTWAVFATIEFSGNSTGRRVCIIGAGTDDSSYVNNNFRNTGVPVPNANARIKVGGVIVAGSSAAYYLKSWQNSGSSLNVSGIVQAVRIK